MSITSILSTIGLIVIGLVFAITIYLLIGFTIGSIKQYINNK